MEKSFHVHKLEGLILPKCLYYSKQLADSLQSLLKCNGILHQSRTSSPKVYMENKQRPLITKATLSNRKKARGITIHDLKIPSKASITQTA